VVAGGRAMIDIQALVDAEELRYHAALMAVAQPKAKCATSDKHVKCGQPVMKGHIFCKHHFLAYGGYDRYSCVRV
jgi:hypothetical protein